MANILEKYGIKEVADVTFYEISASGTPGKPVLYLDTLKVSTIEQTAEESEAKGGKGNPSLLIWDYGREITVDIQDALFSMKSMAIMFGDYSVGNVSTATSPTIYRTFEWTPTETVTTIKSDFKDANGTTITLANPEAYDQSGTATTTQFVANKTYLVKGKVSGNLAGQEIEISPNSFPGTYYVTGDTFARAYKDGKDEMFQFVIPKAKVQSEQTITLEAEGDPTVFNLKLRVLRPDNGGAMMKLVKYTTATTAETVDGDGPQG